jgi:serine/threonine-protein kinase
VLVKRRTPHGPLPGRGVAVVPTLAGARPASAAASASDGPHALAARSRLGRVLCDKWRLDELLGVGGVAAVYAATHRNGRRVAIKLMHSELALDESARERFLREGYLANQVQHPAVVSVLDDDVAEDGAPLLVMELLDGESIQTRWERKGHVLQPGEVLSIADQALDVLAAAHARGVVHRDIKPANLFLTRAGVIKLLDFGLAREAQSSVVTIANSNAFGTPAFLPPEQALGRSELVDGRTDLWALGATMLTLLSGRHVHQANTLNELLLAAMTRAAPRSADVLPGLPRDVGAIIDRALAFEQKDRWPDARAMQHAVREAYQSWSSMSVTTPMRGSTRSRRGAAEAK